MSDDDGDLIRHERITAVELDGELYLHAGQVIQILRDSAELHEQYLESLNASDVQARTIHASASIALSKEAGSIEAGLMEYQIMGDGSDCEHCSTESEDLADEPSDDDTDDGEG